MPIALSLNEVREYQLKSDRLPSGETDPDGTVFLLGQLTPKDEANIMDKLTSIPVRRDGAEASDASINLGSQINEALRLGLRGWRNFLDENGNDVPFPSAGGRPLRCNVDGLYVLSPEHRRELGNEIMTGQEVTTSEGN